MEGLTAYIRENAPKPTEPSTRSQTTDQPAEVTNKVAKRWLLGAPADIQAILDVLRRREEDRAPEERRCPLDLRRIDLRGANLLEVNLLEVNLLEANLADTELEDANLQLANLSNADLGRARFSYADIQGTNLQGAYLPKAYLLYAQLNGADLRGAFLYEANFHSADLEGADLKGAILRGADLRYALSLTQEQIEEAIGDKKTKLPEDLTRPESWTESSELVNY